MRLVLALKIEPVEKPEELALQVLSCLEKLPLSFSTILAFTPDEELTETVIELNKIFAEKRND